MSVNIYEDEVMAEAFEKKSKIELAKAVREKRFNDARELAHQLFEFYFEFYKKSSKREKQDVFEQLRRYYPRDAEAIINKYQECQRDFQARLNGLSNLIDYINNQTVRREE